MRRALVGTLLVAWGCAHTPPTPDLGSLKVAAQAFHERIRWKDFRSAEDFIAPERQKAFERARIAQHDERDLSVTDYEIEDVQLGPDQKTGRVIARMRWVRMPSITEADIEVTSDWVEVEGAWRLKSQDAGPFLPELAR